MEAGILCFDDLAFFFLSVVQLNIFITLKIICLLELALSLLTIHCLKSTSRSEFFLIIFTKLLLSQRSVLWCRNYPRTDSCPSKRFRVVGLR